MSLRVLILQIITESLPISSSGHCALLEMCHVPQRLLWIMHIPTLLAMGIVLLPRWNILLRYPQRTTQQWIHLVTYGCVTELLTVPIYCMIRHYELHFSVACGFGITAILLWSVSFTEHLRGTWSLSTACALGCAQGIAALPGISRLGITYVVGRWCGLQPRQAFDMACSVAVPIFAAAAVYGLYTIPPHELGVLSDPTSWIALCIATVCGIALLYLCRQIVIRGYAWIFSCYLIMVTLFLLVRN